MILVIVESPAKCKKIEGYLGTNYKCVASYGHVRELPSLKYIDIKNRFTPSYTIIDNDIKRRNIEILGKQVAAAKEVILATDDDREGEAIAWHLCELFHLDVHTTKRIVFHEITETAIQDAIKHPRTIDMNIVQAQKTRQILDVLVGFKVSPVLWRLISMPKGKEHALSAGRCQTPALKLVYDNYKKIEQSVMSQVFHVVGYFTSAHLPFELHHGELTTDTEMVDFLSKSIEHEHLYTCSSPVLVQKPPPSPFTTSRLQQVASNELHYSPKETMSLCQRLYEGGYITYMRTDSTTYSKDFIEIATDFIQKKYGERYVLTKETTAVEAVTADKVVKKGKKTKREKTKPVKSQEAHEAIRPTNLSLEHLPESMCPKEKRMYRLIWTNTLESIMPDATFHSITATITAPKNMKYRYTAELIYFPGWKIVENKYNKESKEYHHLQMLKSNVPIDYKKITSKVSMRGIVSHYTEAMLVQLLEEKGIGRPSTFSFLVDKIQERGYVVKQDVPGKERMCKEYELEKREIREMETKREFGAEKNKLVIQPLGVLVVELLEKYFNPLFAYAYTSSMENALDTIAKGDEDWVNVCSSCNTEVDSLVEQSKAESKYAHEIDETHTLVMGKFGPVIKCVDEKDGTTTFQSVRQDIDMSRLDDYTLDELVTKNEILLGEYEGREVIVRTGKYGLYALWGTETVGLKELGKRTIESIRLEEVLPILSKGRKESSMIRVISPSLSVRKGPRGDYLFYKTPAMKKPSFFDIKPFYKDTQEDYKICELTILTNWIQRTYQIK